MRDSANHVLAAIGVVLAVGGVAIVQLIVPQFEDVFRNFGADLPWLSGFIVHGRLFFWALPLLAPIVAIVVRPRSARDARPGVLALLLGLAIAFVVPAISLVAMYLPIFGLAAAEE